MIHRAAVPVLCKLRAFVEYTRPLLPGGTPKPGDLIPRQADADALITEIDCVLEVIRSADPAVN